MALGFSLIENLGYALGAPFLLGLRSVTATPMHIIFSTTMALVFATNISKNKFLRSLFKAVLVASFFHGLYDALIFLKVISTTHLYLIIMLALLWGKKVFGYTLLNSPHRKDMLTVLSNSISTAPKLCVGCGKESAHNSYAFQKASVEECQACESVVLSGKKAVGFLNFFLPHYQVFIGRNEEFKGKLNAFFGEFHDQSYNLHRKFKIKEASPLVEALAEEFRKVFEKSTTFSFVFSTRPVLATENGIVNEQYRNTINSEGFKIITILAFTFAALGGFTLIILALI